MATAVTLSRSAGPWTRSRALASRFAWAVVAYNVLVILWGALVRATGSGAGCGNHWPLCNGEVVPMAPSLHTVIEFTHRAMTGGATFAVLGMLLWTFRSCAKREAARTAAVLATLLLLNEAFLGALLVKLGYVTTNRSLGRVVLLSVHLSNTLLLLGALTLTAVLLPTERPRRWLLEAVRGSGAAVVGLLATLVVGVSGSLAALGDTLFPSPDLVTAIRADLQSSSPLLLRVRWVHPAAALVAAVYLVWLTRRTWAGTDGPLARLLVAVLAFQMVLGVLDVLLLAPTWMQLVHLAGADVFWVLLVTLSVRGGLRPETAATY